MKTATLSALVVTLFAGQTRAADAPSFTKDVAPFMKTYCLECHSGVRAKKGIVLDSVASMLKGRSLLVPGNPERSRFYQTMVGGGKHMPPRKYDKQPTKDEIAMIKAWIVAGARDDTPKTTGAGSSEEAAVPGRRERIGGK